MFVLDGRPLAIDTPFEANDTLYPANWLRLATPEARAAIGITEVPDPAYYDQRFYWGYTASGTLIPKDHSTLVSGWAGQTNQTAYTLLLPYDWQIIRQIDDGTPADPLVVSWRQQIRVAAAQKVTSLQSTATTDELAQYVTGSGYPMWPPLAPLTPPEPSGVIPSGATGSDTVYFASYSATSQFS